MSDRVGIAIRLPSLYNCSSAIPKQPLKVGVIVDSEQATRFVYEFVQWAQAQKDLIVPHLIVRSCEGVQLNGKNGSPSVSGKTGFLGFIRQKSFQAISELENRRIKKAEYYGDYLERFDLTGLGVGSTKIIPFISAEGTSDRFSPEDIQKVKNEGLDLIVSFTSEIETTELRRSSRWGVLSLSYPCDGVKRSGPPGFWAVYSKHESTEFAIQHLTPECHVPNILVSGRLPTKRFYLLNQAALYTKAFFYLRELLNGIAVNGAVPRIRDIQPNPTGCPAIPGLPVQMKYAAQEGFGFVHGLLNRTLLKRDYRWGVAYGKTDWQALTMSESCSIPNPPNHYLADPFVVTEGDQDYCFVEDYDYKSSRGSISVYVLRANKAERLGPAIVEPFHMSFPYLFRFGSRLFMCPETSQKREIRVYECVHFPLKWKLYKTLMSGISAVDTMIFERDGVWWLFTNIDPTNTENHCSELFIFYSDHPFDGKWQAHPQNPIFADSDKGRNAGILYDDNSIYRVAQRQGFDSYGKGFSINKITVLNKNEYSEAGVRDVEPNFFPNLVGCHHLHSNGKVSVFDYLRFCSTKS